jgi:RNA polymerase sigma-70 factor, ECF subfamily
MADVQATTIVRREAVFGSSAPQPRQLRCGRLLPGLLRSRSHPGCSAADVTNPPRPFVSAPGVPHTRDDRRDRELLRDLASGQREALGELFDRHSASLFRHGLALTRRTADAEDLVQSVFVKLATTGAELLGVRTPASYLHRMLSTTWLDSQRRTVAGERAAEISKMDPVESHPFGLESAIDIGRALDALPDVQREAVVPHVFDGFSFREVGRATGVSLFTAAARYRLAIARMRKTLEQMPEETT